MLGWISINQPELLENYEKMQNGIQFEADILDKDKVDLGLTLRLTERVVVGTDAQGNTTVKHAGEPQRVAGYLDPNWVPGSQDNASEWVVPDDK